MKKFCTPILALSMLALSAAPASQALAADKPAARSAKAGARAHKPPPGINASCPTSVALQYRSIAAVKADGPAGAIQDFTPGFLADERVRLVGAHVAVVHGGGTGFTEVLNPDELIYRPGRPMRWTLSDGREPAPTDDVLVYCEYEGGLVLQKRLGARIRHCNLVSAVARRDASGPPPAREAISRAAFNCPEAGR
jgi:hypothetical protein